VALVLLVMAIAAALIWANSPLCASYDSFWASTVSIHLCGHVVSNDLRSWINEGLMTRFFLVVGLEAKRELDLGELRDRRRLAVPVLAGLSGVVASTVVYLAVTSGRGGAGNRLRVFLLIVLVIDDLAAAGDRGRVPGADRQHCTRRGRRARGHPAGPAALRTAPARRRGQRSRDLLDLDPRRPSASGWRCSSPASTR
jgi:hypothetical protein